MKRSIINCEFVKILISLILFILSFVFKEIAIIYFCLIVTSYLIISYEMYIKSFKNILKGEFFDENILMIIASIGAFYIGEYPEAIMVILLFMIGEYLSDLAVGNSKDKVRKLLDLKVDSINVLIKDKVIEKRIEEVQIGELFQVKPGEKIGLDGIVTEGEAYIDTSSLTGESIPKKVSIGDTVLSGSICNDQVLIMKATSIFETSTANKILEIIENSPEKKASSEKFITKFSKIYTPTIIVLALIIMIAKIVITKNIDNSVYTALVFLVRACPCALVLSVPLSFFCGIGRASKEGILIKGAMELENVKKIKSVMLDKTGTLTKGNFEVTEINTNNITKEKLLEIVAHAEYYSNHPIAKSILKRYKGIIKQEKIKAFEEIKGKGISVTYDNEKFFIGNSKLLKENGIEVEEIETIGTIIYIATAKKYLGNIVISDEIKESSKNIAKKLNEVGINKITVLSGDNDTIVKNVADQLNIKNYFSSLLPPDKVNLLKEEKKKCFTAYIGDGINDAPVLKIADLGFSMGGVGSDAAIEASDIVLMHDNLDGFIKAIKISKFTDKLIKFNITFALLIKTIILILGVLNITSIWLAVFADVGVTIICVLNTLQILKRKF